MSPKDLDQRIVLARVLSPSILIGIGFLIFLYVPNQKTIQSRIVEMEKRAAGNSKNLSSVDILKSHLDSLKKENSAIESECLSIVSQLESFSTATNQRKKELKNSNSHANAIASTLDVFRRNKLICIDSKPFVVPSAKEDRSQSHSMKVSAPNEAQGTDRSHLKYQAHLQGRFEDIRSALSELQNAETNVVPISIEMEEPDPLSEQRNWTIILEIEQRTCHEHIH